MICGCISPQLETEEGRTSELQDSYRTNVVTTTRTVDSTTTLESGYTIKNQAIPQSDFTLSVPSEWEVEPAIHPLIIEPTGLYLKQSGGEIEYVIFSYRFHEGQNPSSVRESFLEQNQIANSELFYVEGIEGMVGYSSPDTNDEVKHLGIAMAEKQLLVFAEYNLPVHLLEESTTMLHQLLHSVEIGEEHDRKVRLAERQSLGSSGFTIQRLENYYLMPDGYNAFRMENLLDPLAPTLIIKIVDFDNEESAMSWLMKKDKDYMLLEQIQMNDIEGYIAEPLSMPDVGSRKFAFLISGREGLEVILYSHYTLPNESEDVFQTAVESILWEQ
jgi:hypothetical protein